MRAETPSVLLILHGWNDRNDRKSGNWCLRNFNFDHLLKHVPELKRFNYRISSYQFEPPLDSSDMEPAYWAKLVKIINYNYDYFDGFVILHGTDTMAYTASALSFMLENLSKPVILTGSQLPIGTFTDGWKRNLITAIEIAAAKNRTEQPSFLRSAYFLKIIWCVATVQPKSMRKTSTHFRSFNYPPLARVGIHIKYEPNLIRKPDPTKPLKPHYLFDTNVVILTLFPGIQESIVTSLLHVPGLKAVVMKTFRIGKCTAKRMVYPPAKGSDRTWNHHCQHYPMRVRSCGNGTLWNRNASFGKPVLSADMTVPPNAPLRNWCFCWDTDYPTKTFGTKWTLVW